MRPIMFGSMFTSSLSSFNSAYSRVESAITRLAQGDLDSLPEDIVDLHIAKVQVAAAAHAWHVADQMSRDMINLLA